MAKPTDSFVQPAAGPDGTNPRPTRNAVMQNVTIREQQVPGQYPRPPLSSAVGFLLVMVQRHGKGCFSDLGHCLAIGYMPDEVSPSRDWCPGFPFRPQARQWEKGRRRTVRLIRSHCPASASYLIL